MDTTSTVSAEPLFTILLPAYNEAEALPFVLDDVFRIADMTYEVLVIDDGSTDDTVTVAGQFPCRVIKHQANRGKGAAVRTGLEQAQGQYVIVMDADGTYPANAIPEIVRRLQTGEVDVVRCNRQRATDNMPLVNRIGNFVFDRLLAVVHGLEGTDHLSGLYGFRRSAILRLQLESEGFDIEAEIGIKARLRGLQVDSFPITYHPRLGEKKLRPWRDGFLILGRIVALFLLYNPLLTFVVPGMVLMGITLLGASWLSIGPIITPYFGLSIHSFVVMALGAVASFQLIVFGLAAALYRLESGLRPARWLVFVSSRPVRLGSAVIGFCMALWAGVELVSLMIGWLTSGAGEFFGTREVVIASAVLVMGMQFLSAALFVSIFAGRLARYRPSELSDI